MERRDNGAYVGLRASVEDNPGAAMPPVERMIP